MLAVAMAIIISTVFWITGFLTSPLIYPQNQSEQPRRLYFTGKSSADYRAEKILAEAYWQRYPDVEESTYWGPQGPMGILGARDHYKQHGRQEGRQF